MNRILAFHVGQMFLESCFIKVRFYRSSMKLREGNVLSRFCLSVQEEGVTVYGPGSVPPHTGFQP